jgi:DNA-binding NtrC family response regulator
MGVLLAYPWPGNVRELRNLIERILILERGDAIRLEHLPPEFLMTSTASGPAAQERPAPTDGTFRLPSDGVSLEEVEKDLVRQAIERSEGNQTRAAQLLGISRDALRYRLQKFGVRA